MERNTTTISREDIARQMDHCHAVAQLNAQRPQPPLAFVDTYGCQQNEADSERIRGYLREMGYGFTQDEEQAQIIVLNTCAIREHAEQRVLGNVGALVHTKRAKPGQLICVCGCMAQEAHVAQKVKESYRHVDLVFGPQVLWRFPEFIHSLLTARGRVFQTPDLPGSIAEGIPVVREKGVKAWVSIMYGCNNFCSYCIVPYVRGRERSREPEDILAEVRQLVEEGYKDITLLGQNVNSYGKDLEHPMDFADLLSKVNEIPGDFLIRFMTSHPKDATQKLFETMARCEKVAPVLHLPFQSGNNRVLKEMNRRYTREQYLEIIRYAREKMPGLSITSDIIVGFPGETYEEFQDTLSLIREVGFTALYTFIFSPRKGTPAAGMPDPVSHKEKTWWFAELLKVQEEISVRRCASMVGKTVRGLVEEEASKPGVLNARTEENVTVEIPGGPEMIGSFRNILVTDAGNWVLKGNCI